MHDQLGLTNLVPRAPSVASFKKADISRCASLYIFPRMCPRLRLLHSYLASCWYRSVVHCKTNEPWKLSNDGVVIILVILAVKIASLRHFFFTTRLQSNRGYQMTAILKMFAIFDHLIFISQLLPGLCLKRPPFWI